MIRLLNIFSLKTIKRATLVFLILEALDLLITLIGINYFGLIEVNPLATTIGFYGLVILKVIGSLFVAGIMQIMNSKFIDILAVVLASPIVIWNLLIIFYII